MKRTKEEPRKATAAAKPIGISSWQFMNGLIAVTYIFIAVRLYTVTDDWWLWAPLYALLAGVAAPLSYFSGACVRKNNTWRYMCGTCMVVGFVYAVATAWALHDARHVFTLFTEMPATEAHHLSLTAFAVFWACVCRISAHDMHAGLLRSYARLLVFICIGVASLMLITYSTCLYTPRLFTSLMRTIADKTNVYNDELLSS